ncbi:MAG: hypothetical protein HY094_00040 [Candidatus Melainabacteria bacterium]|nr:hypothetical protein [Candidatus Melainabacteria bacterium]
MTSIRKSNLSSSNTIPIQVLRTEKSTPLVPEQAGKTQTISSDAKRSLLKSLWERTVDFVKSLFGIARPDGTLHQKFEERFISEIQNEPQDPKHSKNPRAVVSLKYAGAAIKYADENNTKIVPADKGIPRSSKLQFLADGPEQDYYYNCIINFIASSILDGYSIESHEDMDDTNTHKVEAYSTAALQPVSQIYELRQTIKALREEGAKIFINTARSLFRTRIFVRNKGLEGESTIVTLDDALNELGAFSTKEKLELSKEIGIAAFTGGIVHTPLEKTEWSPELLLMMDLLKFLGPEFIQECFIDPTIKHEFAQLEPKALFAGIHDLQRTTGKSYYPHSFNIVELKEKFVDNRNSNKSIEEGWKDFACAVKENIDAGAQRIPQLEHSIEEIQQELNQLKASNQDQELNKKVEELEQKLKNKKEEYFSYIRVPGSPLDPKTTYVNGWGKTVQCPDYYDFLCEVPKQSELKAMSKEERAQAFFELYTDGKAGAMCFHFYNSRQTPYQNAIPDFISMLRGHANGIKVDEGNEVLARDIFRRLNYTFKKDNPDVKAFVAKGKKIFNNGSPTCVQSYLMWRLLRHMKHTYNKEERDNSSILVFKNSTVRFSDGFLQEWKDFCKENKLNESASPFEFKNWLNKRLTKSNGIERELVEYIETIFPPDFFEQRNKFHLSEEYFYPDELFSRNNRDGNGNYSFISNSSVVDKTTPIRKSANGYGEFQPDQDKKNVLPSFRQCVENYIRPIAAGDSPSDIGMLVGSLERNGLAIVVSNKTTDRGLYNEAIKQRIKYVKEAKIMDDSFDYLAETCSRFGIYGLESVNGGYRKITSLSDTEHQDKKIYSKEEIIEDLKSHYKHRIARVESPAAKIRTMAEALRCLTGIDIDFDRAKFKKAKEIFKNNPDGIGLSKSDRDLFEAYRWAVVREKNRFVLSDDSTRFRAFFEYHYYNPNTEKKEIFIKRKSDGKLVNKDAFLFRKEELFTGDESELKRVLIKRNNQGVFVKYFGDKEDVIKDPTYLNYCFPEEEFLPSTSPIKGIFAREGLLKFIGLGNIDKGRKHLKNFLVKLPLGFNKMLEWCGGLMALGGLVRLGSKLTGGFEEPIYKAGYWLSNSIRAVSALAGGLRGQFNVQKYHDITFAEIINIFSALKLPNGFKHLGIGVGNFLLFLGRGRQRAQAQQMVNSLTPKEVKTDKPEEGVIDPRPFVRDITKFSNEDMILSLKNAARKNAQPPILGEIVGNMASAIMTPVKMMKDIIQNPKLIFQMKKRVSERSGNIYRTVPSAGHLMTLVGALSGIGALIGGTFGRIGEVAEDGFNRLGKYAISFANSIPALGIIANGFEVAASPQGLQKTYGSIDGSDSTYDPKGAGLGQVLAGIGYGILPWFGLHNNSVAASYDVVNGLYFGLPNAGISVSEEEKHNTESLVRSILIEGQELYTENESSLMASKKSKQKGAAD